MKPRIYMIFIMILKPVINSGNAFVYVCVWIMMMAIRDIATRTTSILVVRVAISRIAINITCNAHIHVYVHAYARRMPGVNTLSMDALLMYY